MPPETLVLVVPVPPTVANRAHGRSRHWRVAQHERLEYWEFLDYLAMKAAPIRCVGPEGAAEFHVPPRPTTPLVRVILASAMQLRGGMDEDGAVSRHKWLLDWLVSRGWIATDRRERKKDGASCRWASFPEQTVSRKAPARITLTIEAA